MNFNLMEGILFGIALAAFIVSLVLVISDKRDE